MCNLINMYTHTYKQVSLIPPWEDQCEWHRMTRMTVPDGAVMCNLINIHTYTHPPTHPHTPTASVFGVDSLLFYSRHFHSACVTISADRGWRLRAPDSSVRKTVKVRSFSGSVYLRCSLTLRQFRALHKGTRHTFSLARVPSPDVTAE